MARLDRRCRPSADSARCRRHCPVAVGKHRKTGLRDPAALARGGSGLSRRGRYIPCALGRRTHALAIRAAGGHWRRRDGHRCRLRGCAVGTKRNWRWQGSICLVPFRDSRPRCGNCHGGNDLSGTGASSRARCAEPSRDSLSTCHGAHLCRSAGSDAARPRSIAVAARRRLDSPAGGSVTALA